MGCPDCTHVTLVVDPQFGQLGMAQAELGPLWMIDSSQNRPVIEELWSRRGSEPANSPTYFNAVPGRSAEESAIAFIGTIIDHHPDWRTLEVIGARPSALILDEFRQYAIGLIEETPRGFIFSKRSDVV
jgi:hypothetical protein